MRKLIVLVSALLLVSMVAIASDVTFSGEVEQRWMQDITNKTYTQAPVVELKLDAVVDDTASLYIEIEEGSSGIGKPSGTVDGVTEANTGLDANGDGDLLDTIGITPTNVGIDKAHFTLDLGAIFDLPVGVTVRTGWDEYDQFDAVKVTFGEYEDIIGSDTQNWGHEVNIAATEQVALRVLWANDPGLEYYSAGVAVTYDPVYVEVSYVNISSDIGVVTEDAAKGDIEAGVEFMQEVADGIDVAAAATLDFDLEEDTTGDSHWAYGAALQGTYNDMVTVGAALRGEQDSEASSMQVDVSATPVEGITVFLVAGLGLDDDVYAETFDSFEGSVMFMLGPSTWYAGLQWIADGGKGIAEEKADFGPAESDSTSIFMRAELKY